MAALTVFLQNRQDVAMESRMGNAGGCGRIDRKPGEQGELHLHGAPHSKIYCQCSCPWPGRQSKSNRFEREMILKAQVLTEEMANRFHSTAASPARPRCAARPSDNSDPL